MNAGAHNALTDVEGILVGHHTDPEAASGVTAILCPGGATAAVDVRGAAPGTRETDLLAPENLVEQAQAVLLCGGSVYGLAAADGAVRWLAERGLGFPLGEGRVAPIVPAAVLFDLGRGRSFIPPIGPAWGASACAQAAAGPVAEGTVGAGTGAVAGGIKGGVGTASLVLDSGITVAALLAVNAGGTVIDPATGRPWEIGSEIAQEFGGEGKRAVVLPAPPDPQPGRNTTIGVVATDALLSKAQALKVAQMAHDGLARAVRPAHTLFDGDTLFCLATGRKPLPRETGVFPVPAAGALSAIGHAAALCTARAIVRAVLSAASLAGIPAFRDLPDRK
ncbi:MAG: P1 family peptidase [Desulfobacterales bacterium]